MIVIYDTLGAYGGSHTLMQRMCEWLRIKNINVTIICTSMANVFIISALKKIGVNIYKADLKDVARGYKILSALMKDESIKTYCFSWYKYLDIESIKKKYNIEFDNILYCIHPQTFKKGIGFNTKFIREYLKNNYRKIFERMVLNDSIVSLDEINIMESALFLESRLEVTPRIIRLPMNCQEIVNKDDIITRGFESNTILAAARAEFPYKGYLIGLIDDFLILKKRWHKIKLEIVSDGDNIIELKNKLKTIPEELKKDVKIHGWIKYDELKFLMKKCKVFVGMGTTVLDAGLQYKPAIVVSFNTYSNKSDHFISEKPTYIGSNSDCKEDAIYRIKQVFEWDFQRYKRECLETFNQIKKIYDIDNCMNELIQCKTKEKNSILTNTEYRRHKFNHLFNDLRFHNKKFADYNNLSK